MHTALTALATLYAAGFLWALIANPLHMMGVTPRLFWAVLNPVTLLMVLIASGDQ